MEKLKHLKLQGAPLLREFPYFHEFYFQESHQHVKEKSLMLPSGGRESNHSKTCPEPSVLFNKSLISREIILSEPNHLGFCESLTKLG